jgi:hypothetical protein
MLKLIYWVMFRIDLCYGLCLGYLKSSWFYADFNYILFVYHSRLVHGIENMRNPSKLVVSLEQLQQWHLFRAPTLFNRGCPQLSGALILSSTPATNPNFRAPTLTTWHVGPTSQWVIYPFLCSWCLSPAPLHSSPDAREQRAEAGCDTGEREAAHLLELGPMQWARAPNRWPCAARDI